MTKNFVRSLAIAALACTGASAVQAQTQTVLQLGYPSAAPGAVPCLYTTNVAGISADPQTGNLVAVGDFTTGCPQTGSALPLPVIVPGPNDWQLPNSWAIGQPATFQWAAVNAASCTYGGSFANGWPSGQSACSTGASCQTLHNVTLSPPSAGQYQFSLTCTNATGSTTSTSGVRTVSSNPPVITAGPMTWSVLPWSSGQTKTVTWSASNADSCGFSATTLPNGVSLQQFLSGGVSVCSSAASCALNNSLTLNATVAGTYGVSLNCTNSSGGNVSSSQSWNVTQSTATCLSPATGWNRLTTAQIYYQSFWQGAGVKDVTEFASIWGRNYSVTGAPIVNQWPGRAQQLVMPAIGINQFVSAKFRTPSSGATKGHTFLIDPTSYGLSGGDGVGPVARVSMTVSTKCGDFDTNSAFIPSQCTASQMAANDIFGIYTNSPVGCSLQPDTEYYLNVIYAPLTSPATAVFNGFNGSTAVTFPQNTQVIP
ncbi:MAG: hypothetical protein WBP11_07765 [Dokdonella sp.]